MEFTTKGNNAWLFQQKYYYNFTWDKKKDEKYALGFFKNRLAQLTDTDHAKVSAPLDKGITNIELLTTYPGLVTGVGVQHETASKGEIKMGFEFDYTTGMPVIRGHSVKGKLRSAFPQRHNENVRHKHEKAYIIHCIINNIQPDEDGFNEFKTDETGKQRITAIEEEIFDGRVNGKYLPGYQQDVFFDAYINAPSNYNGTKAKYLGSDSITPHQPNLLKNPRPLPFLKVLPGVQFQFRFKLNDNTGLDESRLLTIKQKEYLFAALLKENGIGAKTNVGYGQFNLQ